MNENIMNKWMTRIPVLLLLIVIALVSIAKIAPRSTDLEHHAHSIEQIDEKIDTVLKLTAGASGASAAISLLPDDQCTPIAEQLAEFAKYFLLVLSVLYLEKYLVSMVGYVSFTFLIPLACAIWGGGYLLQKDGAKAVAYKLAACALAIYFIIPFSVKTSDLIYENYDTSIQSTLDAAEEISIVNEDSEGIEKFTAWIVNATETVVDYVTGLLSQFLDSLAVMIVTSCLIPLLVVLFFWGMIKLLFGSPGVKVISQIAPGKVLAKRSENESC